MCEVGNISGELNWSIGDEKAKLKFSESAGGIKIDTIVVPASCRGKGIGSILINQVIACANLAGKDIYLSARPLGGSTSPERLERLVHFYAKLGFKEIDRGVTVCHMMRTQTSI